MPYSLKHNVLPSSASIMPCMVICLVLRNLDVSTEQLLAR